MQRLIDANEILKSEHQHYDYMADEYYVLVRDIENAPTVDAEPVVRCKDCKWGDVTDYGAGEVLECVRDRLYRNSISLEGETYFRKVEPDDFCSWGERRQ